MLKTKKDIAQPYDNTDINRCYTAAVLPLFDHLPEIQNEISERSKARYAIVGYKGTSKRTADSFVKYGVSVDFSAGGISGTAHGDGVYLTPSFDIAKDFAELTVRRDAAYIDNRKELLTPPEPPNIYSLGAAAFEQYENAVKLHDEICDNFYTLPDCKNNMYFLIFFVKDFFQLTGKQLAKTERYTESLDTIYDYIEGARLGRNRWEIKFNKRAYIYEKIRILSVPYMPILEKTPLPNLPNGTTEMRCYADLKISQYPLTKQSESTSQETKFLK